MLIKYFSSKNLWPNVPTSREKILNHNFDFEIKRYNQPDFFSNSKSISNSIFFWITEKKFLFFFENKIFFLLIFELKVVNLKKKDLRWMSEQEEKSRFTFFSWLYLIWIIWWWFSLWWSISRWGDPLSCPV